MKHRTRLFGLAVGLSVAAAAHTGALAQGWWSEGTGVGVVAGTVVEGALAGLRLECSGDGRLRTVLSHNGATLDRSREHTVVLSVDGAATVLRMRAQDSGRRGDDDLVREDPAAEMAELVAALQRGREIEISAPTGRYRLPLSGSSRALAPLATACGL